MTTIAALVDGSTVHLAADSIFLSSGRRWAVAQSKLVGVPSVGDDRPEAVIGIAGLMAILQWAARTFSSTEGWPAASDPRACDRWATEVAEQIAVAALDHHPPWTDEDDEPDAAGMLAYGGAIWHLDIATGSAQRLTRSFGAVGSGARFAVGYLAADTHEPPGDRVRRAVEVAVEWDDGSGGPADVETVES